MDRYDPFESMERMFDQMRRSMMMDPDAGMNVYDASGERPMGLPAGEDSMVRFDQTGGRRGTHVRLEPTDEGYVAVADVPGFDRDELTVSLTDDRLHIEGVHEETEDDETSVRSLSRRVSETVRVPEGIDRDAVGATYRNGILEVTLPTLEAPEDDATVIDIE